VVEGKRAIEGGRFRGLTPVEGATKNPPKNRKVVRNLFKKRANSSGLRGPKVSALSRKNCHAAQAVKNDGGFAGQEDLKLHATWGMKETLYRGK